MPLIDTGFNERKAWTKAIQSHKWYGRSCWLYTALGLYLIMYNDSVFRPYSPHFPWTTMSVALIINGYLSFMADVATWGERHSLFKMLDIVSASILTAIQTLHLVMHMLGLAHWPPQVIYFFVCVFVFAIYVKRQSTKALKAGISADAYIYWHVWWHLSLPAGAFICSLLADASTQPPHPSWRSLSETE